MREPNDIFVREFYHHPMWEEVIVDLTKLAKDLSMDLLNADPNSFQKRQGIALGVYEAISFLRTKIADHHK